MDRGGNEGDKRACEQAGKLAAVGGEGARGSRRSPLAVRACVLRDAPSGHHPLSVIRRGPAPRGRRRCPALGTPQRVPHQRAYGGPEEGGWWYDTGTFTACRGRYSTTAEAREARDAPGSDAHETPPRTHATQGHPVHRLARADHQGARRGRLPCRPSANGGAKLDHGSGGMVLPRRSKTLPVCQPFPMMGRAGGFTRELASREADGAVSQGPSGVPGRDERARGGAPFRGLAREREEDACVLRSTGVPTHGAGAPSEARWIDENRSARER